jgi:hypothetical protein
METIQYRGAYRFTDREALDRALVVALASHGEWKPRFDPIGSSLRVVLDLPARNADARRDADHVMETLAELALEGIVVARHRDLAVDVFMCAIRATTAVVEA